MRCTKCSFISFDDLSTCAKCASDLSRLAKELNGTCTETRQEFFLGTAIQATGIDDENFSDSQVLPPIDHSDMNFDDTSTGGFSPLSSSLPGASSFGFDDSVNVIAEDDVAIELGDIMPIDFEQLDSGSVLSDGALEHTDALPSDDFSFDFDKTDTVLPPTNKEIDLDLTAGFDDSGSNFKFDDDLSDINISDLSEDFPLSSAGVDSSVLDVVSSEGPDAFSGDADFELDQDLFEQLADASGGFDETTSLNADAALNETQVSLLSGGAEDAGSLELDESLVAELAGSSSRDVSGEFPSDFAIEHSASGDFELDPALVAELASSEESPVRSSGDLFSGSGSFSDDTVGFDDSLEFERGSAVDETMPLAHVEDLTGDFPPIREDDDTVLSGLDLADIDVSDLVDTADSNMPATTEAEVGLYSQQNRVSGQSELNLSAVDDVVSAEVSRQEHGALDLIDDDDDMEFGGGGAGEELEGIDDIQSSGSEIDDLADEIDLLEGGAPPDLSSLSLDDTFRESGSADGSVFSSGEDSVDDVLDDELLLDRSGEDLAGLTAEIEGLALDADFEAFLNKTAPVDKIPEIDLIPDDDGPPDLPS